MAVTLVSWSQVKVSVSDDEVEAAKAMMTELGYCYELYRELKPDRTPSGRHYFMAYAKTNLTNGTVEPQ